MHFEYIHRHLEAHWHLGTPLEVTKRAFAHSLSFGVFEGAKLVGWARVISDRAVVAYVADVFVLAEYRGQGLGSWLMEGMLAHPELQGLRRWMLSSHESQCFYARYGFKPLAQPQDFLERFEPKPHKP